jgi:hypothetical protein
MLDHHQYIGDLGVTSLSQRARHALVMIGVCAVPLGQTKRCEVLRGP